VECLNGDQRLIRVTDNGSSIPMAEVSLAFAHHATRKITNLEDLNSISTAAKRWLASLQRAMSPV